MRRTVLIVDDMASCSDTLALALAPLTGIEIRTAASADEALRVMNEAPVAAVVTDLQMPRIDGFELIRRIRMQARFATIPIVVISGDSDASTPDRARLLGAAAFFAKPFSPNAVRIALEQLLYE